MKYFVCKVRLVHVHTGVRQYRKPNSDGCWKMVISGQTHESLVHKVRMIYTSIILFDNQWYFERAMT